MFLACGGSGWSKTHVKRNTYRHNVPTVDTRRRLRRREDNELSVDPKRRKTIDLYTKEREGKLNSDCQSRSPMPSISAEPSSSPWGQARPMRAGEAGGGRRSQWGP
jgi:hypothetical protein